MLKSLNLDQARFIALLAQAARAQRDALLGRVGEEAFRQVKPARGEHNPTAALGFDPLPATDSQLVALREAIGALSVPARREVYALMRIGQGHLAANKWHRGLADAEHMGDETVAAAIMDDLDLHDHLTKGLYEAKLMT